MTAPYYNKDFRVVQALAQRQIIKERDLSIGTMMSEPAMKHVAGPNATEPFDQGDDPSADPDAILAWFADVKISASNQYVHDALIPVQARTSIGQKGSPVTVWRDPSTGAYQIVGRANRVTETQSVKTYSLLELGLAFVKGQRVVGGNVYSPFYQYTGATKSILSATVGGRQRAGLYRGASFISGVPVTTYSAGSWLEVVPFGEIDFGTDQLGVLYSKTYNPDGTITTVKVDPVI